jgi:hypothetical protein
VPEKDQSSAFDENEEVDFEVVTPSQQEVTNEVSKILESAHSSEEDQPVPSRPPAIKGISIIHSYFYRAKNGSACLVEGQDQDHKAQGN